VWGAAVGTIATIAVVGTKMKSYIFPPSVRDPPGMPFLHAIVARLLLRGAPGVRLEVHQIIVRGSDELNGAFATIARERADAVIIQGSLPAVRLDPKIRSAGGNSDVIQREFRGAGPRDRQLRGSDSQRRQARRSSGAAADQIRIGDLPGSKGFIFVAPLHFTANVRDHVGARGF
jgi:hypothetical protein